MSIGSITCVVPAFNSGGGLTRTLDSIAMQTTLPQEVIVIDDGSKDDSATRAEAHALRPRVIIQANAGAAVARYKGVLAATSDIVAFTDAGDECSPDRLAVFLECFDRYPQVVAATARVRFEGSDALSKWYGHDNEDFGLIEDPLGRMLGQSWPIAIAMNIAVRRHVAVEACEVPVFFRAANDYALQIQCAAHGAFAIARNATLLYESTVGGISQQHGLAKQNAFALVAAARALRLSGGKNPAHTLEFKKRLHEEVGAALVESMARGEWALARSLATIAGPALLKPQVLRRGWWHVQRRRQTSRQ